MDWNSQHTKEVGYSPEFFPTIHSTGDMAVQIVTSGPDTEHEQIKMTYLKMISLAKREILIQTPYYIPDGSIHEALKLALLSGVKSISKYLTNQIIFSFTGQRILSLQS